MKYQTAGSITLEYLEEYTKEAMVYSMFNDQRKRLRQKGLKVMGNYRVWYGHNVIYNSLDICLKFEAFKVPRFIKL